MTGKSKKSIYAGGWIEATPEQLSECRLWRAVIAQSIYDLNKPDPKKRDEVVNWMESKDFDLVCSLALVEPDNVRKKLEEHKNNLTALNDIY